MKGTVSLLAAFLFAVLCLSYFPRVVSADDMTMSSSSAQMPMVEATSVDSFTVKATALQSSGWTATASDQQSGYPASNVLDANTSTMWHSLYSPTLSPLPHWITIDMNTIRYVSGLTYLPRQDTSSNGNIGQYVITVSNDGTSWSSPVATGTFLDDNALKTIVFPSIEARFVRLTAKSEAGNRGPWSSAAEIQLLGNPPQDPVLSRIGWSATASDQQSTNPASNVLDGNGSSIWHSLYKPTPAPLPHSITIDMQSQRTITGLAYLPRQDSSSNGNIGQYSISVSTDGTSWSQPVTSGTWADDKTQKVASFSSVSARFVKLTAFTEAGNRGPWTSASEISVLGPGVPSGVGGKWDAPIGFPIVPVSAIVLPNNKLLTFAAYSVKSFDKTNTVTKVSILDLNTGVVGQTATINTNHQMFCVGLAILSDGRLLINGGSSDSATTLYTPSTNTWTIGPLMNIPRAYEGDTTLSTGQVFTIGGSWYDSAGSKNGEVFTPSGTTGTWTTLPNVTATNILTADPAGVYRADNHAWLFAIANGGVFHAGPSKQMNWITTSGSGSIISAGNRADSADAMNGNAVMYDVGKILTVGGATVYQDVSTAADTQATTRAYTVDITGGPTKPVIVKRVSDMSYPRVFNNSVVLPDGKVLVLGGQQHPQPFTDTGASMAPELWDPTSGSFTLMAADIFPRTYHSIALLLPDGRVFSGGGGLCGSCTVNHFDGRIFTPPYLLNSDGSSRTRPAISSSPSSATHGTSISVTTNTAISSFSLLRSSAVTHTVNNDQRRIPLTPSSVSGTTYTLRLPSDTGVLLPGTYMLFALDGKGTPSVAKFIQIH